MEKLVFFYNQGHERHFEAGHPERPERVEAIVDALTEQTYWTEYPKIDAIDLPKPVLESIHDREFLAVLEATCRKRFAL